MKLLYTLLATLSLASAESRLPNIVYIIADDLGYGDLSCYGQEHFETPNLDQMAAEGMRFTSHYSGSTVCAPSRSALMTGQDTGHTFLRGNGAHQLRPTDTTVAELLKKAGYRTGMVGKSCVTGNTMDPQAPHVAGFDYFWGTLSHRTAHYHYPKSVFSQGKVVPIPGNNGKTGSVYIQDRYTEKSLEFIEESQEQPFFLLLAYSVPHATLQAPPEAVEPFIGTFEDEVSYAGDHYLACEHVKATHAAMVTRLDQHVGQVMAKLKELGLEENTLICFTSDNGSHTEGGYHFDLLKSNGELRGGKRDLYEGGIRVPFIVKWPHVVAEGAISEHVSAFWDFMPTVCEISGVSAPENIQGLSYLPTLKGATQPKHQYLYWELTEKGGRVALRQGEWKVIRYNVRNRKQKAKYELYNLAEDLSEQHDVAAQHPDKVKELVSLLKSARTKSPINKWNMILEDKVQ